MRTYRIHVIRHGLTLGNEQGAYIGVTDLPLSPAGVRNLKNLTDQITYPTVEKVYTSPLLRCRQTASILYPDFTAENMDNLREYDFGVFEGRTAVELESDPDFFRWTSGQIPCPPGGEDSTEFAKRICLGLNEVVLDMMDSMVHDAALIVHGGVIMTLLSCTALPRRRNFEWACEPGRGYTLIVNPSLYHSSGVVEVKETI